MGFGHRVYKNFDPRAKVMKQSADEVLGLLGIENNPTLQVAKELERIALEDSYFIEKKLYPNVDFYSGIILDAIGFPTSMFTPIFALARTVGWITPVEGDAAGPGAEDRPAAAALHRARPSATTWMSRTAEARGQRLGRARRAPTAERLGLDDRGASGSTQGTRTAEEAARACGCAVAQIVKSIVFRVAGSDRHVLFLTGGDARVDPAQGRRRWPARRSRRPTRPASARTPASRSAASRRSGHLTPIETWFDPGLLAPSR